VVIASLSVVVTALSVQSTRVSHHRRCLEGKQQRQCGDPWPHYNDAPANECEGRLEMLPFSLCFRGTLQQGGTQMLVLTLYDGEAVHIGDDIRIVMDRCIDDGNSTRLAIEAPVSIKVLRQELLDDEKRRKVLRR